MTQGEIVDPQAFIDTYGLGATVAFDNGMEMTLGQALQFEAKMCPADADQREDPTKRVGKLANMLAAGGSLRPEHEQYLSPLE